jgi:hypothetical protein
MTSTFGKSAIGGTAVADMGINYQSAFGPYTLSEAGTVVAMWVYLEGGASGTTDIELQIWADSAGSPGALQARSIPRTFTGPFAAGWQRFTFPAGIALAAASYHLGWHVGGSALTKFYYDSSAGNRHYKANAYTIDPIDPYGSADGNDAIAASIYVEYQPTVTTTEKTRTGASMRRRGGAISRRAVAAAAAVRRVTSGLLLSDGFASLSAWTNEGSWGVDATRPCYIAYPSTPVLLAGGSVGSDDGSGPREPHLIAMPDKPDGTKGRWYLFYDAGDGNTSGANAPWGVQLAYSDDRGLTWTKLGRVGGLTNGSYPSHCMGGFVFLHSDGQWYLYGLAADALNAGSIPSGNYQSEMYKAPGLAGSFTFIRESPALGGSGAFDEQCDVIGWVEQTADGTWHAYYSARALVTSGDPAWNVGHATATTPDGPWTKDGSGGYTAAAVTKKADGTRPENPKKWYSRVLAKHVISANAIASDGGIASGNVIWYADSQTDFRAADVYSRRAQQLVAIDGNHTSAPTAIGIPAPVCDQWGRAIQDERGRVGFIFDGNPTGFGDSALGRKILQGVWEPAASAAKYTAPDTTARHLAQAVTHADFVAEWDLELDAAATSSSVAFAYRRSASSADDAGNGYAIQFDLTGTVYLKKLTGGTYSTLTSVAFVALAYQYLNDIDSRNLAGMRVRLVVIGGLHRLYLDDALKISFFDTTYLSGSAVTFWGQKTHWIRNFHLRSSSNVIVTGCPPGATVTLRGPGGVVIATTTADMFGTAAVSPTHSPGTEIEVGGRACPVPEGVYGGDTFQFVG